MMTSRYVSNLNTYINERRCGQDRRKYSYTIHIPERRTGTDRRSMKERRSFLDRRNTFSGKISNKPEIKPK